MEYVIQQIPGFIIGVIISAVAMFFILHNNKKTMDAVFSKMKTEFDEKERSLREAREALTLEAKVKEILTKLGVIK